MLKARFGAIVALISILGACGGGGEPAAALVTPTTTTPPTTTLPPATSTTLEPMRARNPASELGYTELAGSLGMHPDNATDDCKAGVGEYSDIRKGTPVEVRSGGQVVGTAQLQEGRSLLYNCAWRFEVSKLKESDVYTVYVGDRQGPTFAQQDLRTSRGDMFMQIVLGRDLRTEESVRAQENAKTKAKWQFSIDFYAVQGNLDACEAYELEGVEEVVDQMLEHGIWMDGYGFKKLDDPQEYDDAIVVLYFTLYENCPRFHNALMIEVGEVYSSITQARIFKEIDRIFEARIVEKVVKLP